MAASPDVAGQVSKGERTVHEAYLFAHMLNVKDKMEEYGRLYYSVSLDGLHWDNLNGGRPILGDYRGHADICKGHDGRYYLVGNEDFRVGGGMGHVVFRVSDDFINWSKYNDYVPDLRHVPDHPKAVAGFVGATKVYFDQTSSKYLVTWHTPSKWLQEGTSEEWERCADTQRTLYVTSNDLRSFSDPPRRLFSWEMATLDVIVRREGDQYFAILKDERVPTAETPTGTTIRVCNAATLVGPYSEPGDPVSPSHREAPTLIPAPNGLAWYLYYERFPGLAYEFSASERLQGPWRQFPSTGNPPVENHCSLPATARHGSMITISREQYDVLLTAFGKADR